MILRRIVIGVLAAVALIQPTTADNRIVLRVNDRIATLHDYQQRLRARLGQIRQADFPAERAEELRQEAGKTVMRSLYEEMLLLSRAEQLGIEISETQIDQAMERSRESFGIPTQVAFLQALQQAGRTEESFRQQLEESLSLQAVVAREVRSKIELEEEELRRYYREHEEQFRTPTRLRLAEVVILEESGLTQEEMLGRGQELCRQVESGVTLADAALPLTETGIAGEVVELGWIERRDLGQVLKEAVWEQPTGACVVAIGRGGAHALHVLEREEAQVPPFEEVREEVRSRYGNERFQEKLRQYLHDLAQRAYVASRPPPAAKGFRELGEPTLTEPDLPIGTPDSADATDAEISEESAAPAVEEPMAPAAEDAAPPKADDATLPTSEEPAAPATDEPEAPPSSTPDHAETEPSTETP